MPLTARRPNSPLRTLAALSALTTTALLLAAGCTPTSRPGSLECATTTPPVGDTLTAALIPATSAYDTTNAGARCWDMLTPLTVTLTPDLGSSGNGTDDRLMHGDVAPASVTARVQAMYSLGPTTDDSYLYLRLQWSDASHDQAPGTWHLGSSGSADPQFPPGWSAWGDDDKLAVWWPTGGRGDSAFAASGCAYACHMSAPMRPSAGGADVWYWKAGGTNPLAYAEDWGASETRDLGPDTDFQIASVAGDLPNLAAGGGPALYKDPHRRQVYMPFGTATTTLDSTVYLLATAAARMEGTAYPAGDTIYTSGLPAPASVPACIACHAANGRGVAGHDLTAVGRDWTFDQFMHFISMPDSSGHPDIRGLTPAQQRDVISRLRAFTLIPRRTIGRPLGNVADVRVENWSATWANGTYTVVLRRRLTTGFSDDRPLLPGQVHPFGLAVMNRDGANHSGSHPLFLRFASQ